MSSAIEKGRIIWYNIQCNEKLCYVETSESSMEIRITFNLELLSNHFEI